MAVKLLVILLLVLGTVRHTAGDVYLHNPRGSNGRNCRNSNDPNRSNDEAERLMDTQNNDKGGYSCGRSYPFDCYKHTDDETQRNECNAINADIGVGDTDEGKSQVNEDGTLKTPGAINTEKMKFYVGSVLPVEWTSQHGAGANSKVHSEIVIQIQCEEGEASVYSFTDDCGTTSGKKCYPRDGTPIYNQDNINIKKVPENIASQDNYRYGRHESYRFYKRCKNTMRNKGLFIADQKLKGDSAIYTRQNPDGTRYGTECPEEAAYYPYWNPSPWIDVAIVTSDMEKCNRDRLLSQNVQDRFYCECASCDDENADPRNPQRPITKRGCEEVGGTWSKLDAWNKRDSRIGAPECVRGAFSRDNHLGNVAGNGYPFYYNFTIPAFLENRNTCVLRLRYNMSSSDYEEVTVLGDSRKNGELTPIFDRNENRDKVFLSLSDLCDREESCKLGHAVNTNQTGRTFQDRSHSFRIVSRPQSPSCTNIYNLNVRGKRGNIVQVYPAVEYDFVPNVLNVTEDDCIHIQWTGSDYNPARNPNDAEGGPPNPNNVNEGKSDRSNFIQMAHERENHMLRSANDFSMFYANKAFYKQLAFVNQDVENTNACLSLSELRTIHGRNNNAADRDHRNCMKISGAKTPYFNAGLAKPQQGTHKFMSTRNNNFSNRGQKGIMIVHPGLPTPAPTAAPETELSGGAKFGIAFATMTGLALVAYGGAVLFPRFKKWQLERDGEGGQMSPCRPGLSVGSSAGMTTTCSQPPTPTSVHLVTNLPSSGIKIATALYDYNAAEDGELSFKKGDSVTILKKDPSGWWEGKSNGVVGIFPSNYVTLSPQNMNDLASPTRV